MHPEVTLYIVRHGQTMLNLLSRAQGWADSPLTPAGRAGAAALGEGLGREGVRFVLAASSDSGRAVETARILLSRSGQPDLTVRPDPRLREWCLGHMEGDFNQAFLTAVRNPDGTPFAMGDLNRRLPEAADYIHDHLDSIGMTQSFAEIGDRLTGALHDLAGEAAASGGGNVLVVSHALAIKTMVWLLCRERMEEVAMIRNASVCRFAYDGGQFLPLALNDTHYLDGAAVPAR